MNKNWAVYAATCAMVVALTGCGGGGGSTPETKPAQEDGLKPYREQVLNWATCDSTILGRALSEDEVAFADRLQCAYLRAPMDYNMPSRGDVSVAMMRLSVRDLAKKRGTLFVNPGGPGVDGLGNALIFATTYTTLSDPSSDMGALQLSLLAEYDVVGFSPRGTGASTRLVCGTNELQRHDDATPEGRTPQVIENMLYNARKDAEACKKNPLTPYINSDTTARDLDLMRGLVGDEKLNYLGYSWGTWLGAWYAASFPERAGRMVLDSNMNFTNNDEDGDFRKRYTMSFQRLWDEVYAPYAARHPNYFNLGSSPEAVRATFKAIHPKVRNAITAQLVKNMYGVHDEVDGALGYVTMAHGLSTAMAATPSGDLAAVQQALQGISFAPNNAQRDANLRKAAVELAAKVMTPDAPSSTSLPWGSAVLKAVKCNDTPAIADPDYWVALGNEYAQKYPLMGSLITESTCAFWGGPSVTRPPVAALAPLDILMVQSQFDGPTATEGALEAFESLPKGHMVYVSGEASHGVFPYLRRCVDAPVIRYLLGESPAERTTVCEAKPLPLDARASVATRSVQASGFKDAKVAEARINQFKRGAGVVP